MPPMFLFIGDIGSLNLGYIYIGLKKGGDGNFYWADGSRLTLPFWDSGKPDAGSGNCGIFWKGGKAPAKWSDSGACDTIKGGCICKMATMN